MPVESSQVSKLAAKDWSWRVYAIILTASVFVVIAGIGLLDDETPSKHFLLIAGGVILGVASLLYLPRVTLWSAAGAACVFVFRQAGEVKKWPPASPLILLLGAGLAIWIYWFTLDTAEINQELLKRLDSLQKRITSIEDKMDRMARMRDD